MLASSGNRPLAGLICIGDEADQGVHQQKGNRPLAGISCIARQTAQKSAETARNRPLAGISCIGDLSYYWIADRQVTVPSRG